MLQGAAVQQTSVQPTDDTSLYAGDYSVSWFTELHHVVRMMCRATPAVLPAHYELPAATSKCSH